MREEFNLETLKKYIQEKKFKDNDRIYCKQYPNLFFIFENDNNENLDTRNFIAYYNEEHDLFSEGSLDEYLKDDTYTFSLDPYVTQYEEK